LQRALHDDVFQRYGAHDRFERYQDFARHVMPGETILDYGCGKGRLAVWFAGDSPSAVRYSHAPREVTCYDPVTFPHLPQPHDVVACLDVLEHVEPHYLGNVIEHIWRLTNRLAYFVIPNAAGTRRMSNGQLAHLTVEGPAFWLEKLGACFPQVMVLGTQADKGYEYTYVARTFDESDPDIGL